MQRIRRRSLAQARADAEAVMTGRLTADQLDIERQPRRRLRHVESQHGRALIRWRDSVVRLGLLPDARWLHHIPNSVAMRSEKLAGLMKAEGLTKGVLDYFLPVRRRYVGRTADGGAWMHEPAKMACGLYIELKVEEMRNRQRGGMTEDQERFAADAVANGYVVCLCYSAGEAQKAVECYLNEKPIPYVWRETDGS